MLITSHIMTELEELADTVAFLCDGRLRFCGSVASLLSRTGEQKLEPAVAALMRAERSRNAGGPLPSVRTATALATQLEGA